MSGGKSLGSHLKTTSRANQNKQQKYLGKKITWNTEKNGKQGKKYNIFSTDQMLISNGD